MTEKYELLNPFPRNEIIAHKIPAGVNPLALKPEQWAKSFGEPATGMFAPNADVPSPLKTEVYCFYNRTHFGVATLCRGYNKKTFKLGKPGCTWDADGHVGVDIYLDPGWTRRGLVMLSMNAAGGHIQKAFAPGTPHYPHRWKNRSFVKPSYWAAICWIEFEDIGLSADEGDVWGLNVMRRDGGPGMEYFGGVSLAPNFDGFKFPEQFCRVRFGHPSPMGRIAVDQSTPGVLRVRADLASLDGVDEVALELSPCWGQPVRKTSAPSRQMEWEVPHRLTDRVMCEVGITVRKGTKQRDVGFYRFYTPRMLDMALDKPGHRYGPQNERLTVRLRKHNPAAKLDVIELSEVQGNQERLLKTIAIRGKDKAEVDLRGLPWGAYVLRGRSADCSQSAECFFNRVASEPAPVKKHNHYLLSEQSDFPDDFVANYFDWKHFARYFDFFKKMGCERIYWMDYGSQADTWMYRHEKGRKTFSLVGDYLNAALIATKQRGMEFFATIKPFETGIEGTMYVPAVPEGSAEANQYFALRDNVGGVEISASDDPHSYPGMFFKHRNWRPPYAGSVSEIRLHHVNDHKVGVTPSDFTLWVSNDNVQYRKFDGKYETETGVRAWKGQKRRYIAFKDLAVTERYMVFTCRKEGGTFVNRAGDFVEVLDKDGRAIETSVGVFPRGPANKDGTPGPVLFNQLGWGVIAGQLVDDIFVMLDYPEKAVAIGIARGTDRELMVPDPSEPNGLAFLLSRIRRAVKAGVDGIQLRLQHHHAHLDLQRFGYSQNVISEYARRYGVDITQVMPDRARFEGIHGDFYTEFYRRVREITDRAGVALFLQIQESQGFMCEFPVQMQWDRWIQVGLADAIVFKNVYPGTLQGEAARVLTRRHGIPVYLNTYDRKSSGLNGEDNYRRFLERSSEAGHDGYMYYEGWGAYRRGFPDRNEPEMVQRMPNAEIKIIQEFAGRRLK